MIYYDKIDLSKGFMVCHYWLFNRGFKYKDFDCNDFMIC